MPVNTQVQFKVGPDRGRSRDWLVKQSLERGSEWILFLDDDHSFPPTLLLQLLSHEQPVVASLYLQRANPFLPIAYASKDDAGMYTPIDLTDATGTGLLPIVGAGSGGMLIRSEVFYKLESPWFLHTDEQSEDLFFCSKAIAAGFPLFVDLDARLGHITPINVVPRFYDDGWVASLIVSPTMSVGLPIGQTE
jgi:GT2 family glycosyltransferase